MITCKSIPRIISISIASFFLAIHLAVTPVSMSQTAITTLTTVSEIATTQPEYTSGGTTYRYSQGNNLKIRGFSEPNGNKYNLIDLVNQININRVDIDGDGNTSDKQLVFFEGDPESDNTINLFPEADENSLMPGAKSILNDVLLSDIINRGSDNLFNNNQNDTNFNNIERVDFVAISGLSAPTTTALQEIGFLILERNGNDPFGIAPITAIDSNGNPTEYGNFLSVGSSEWGDTGIAIDTQVLRDDNNDNRLRASAYVTGQTIHSIFFSYGDLGITANQVFYGYSLFGGDVTSSDNLLNPDTFPPDTNSEDGGLDLIASGGIFALEGDPDLLLVKRITQINGIDITGFDNNDGDTKDDNLLWPIPKDNFLRGAVSQQVKPGDTVEYTIYYLSAGRKDARNVAICDLISDNQTFVRNAFNSQQGGNLDVGIAAIIRENPLPNPLTPTDYFSNISGDDPGSFVPPGITPPSKCDPSNGSLSASDNTNGLIVVDIVENPDTLPPAISQENPPESYGLIRFQTTID